jgi:carbon storage regulator
MLVIRRRAGQAVLIGGDIEIEVLEVSPGKVKLGITAPKEVLVLRKEIDLTREQNLLAARGASPEMVQKLTDTIRPVRRQEDDGRQQIAGA